MAGRLAPFIELGVGFNVELTARENVVLNGVMMGLTPQRDPRPPRRRDRVRRTRRIRRPEAEELLLGDAGPARLLADDGGRRRHPPDRRGAGGRRRRLPAEVRRRLPRDESGRQDDRPRHPRDGDRRGVLPPGDADQTTARSQHIGDPGEVGRQLPAAQLRTAAATPPPRRGEPARARRCGCSTPGSRTPAAAPVDQRRAGRADPPAGRAGDRCSDLPAARASASCVANADGVGIFQFGIAGRRRDGGRELRGRAAGQGQRPSSRTRSPPGATSSTAASTVRTTRGVVRCTSTSASTSSSSAATRSSAAIVRSRIEIEAAVEAGADER